MREPQSAVAFLFVFLSSCTFSSEPVGSGGDGDDAGSCVAAPLPLQNPRSHTLGDTFYLPRLDTCGADAAWTVSAAPPGSQNRVYMTGAPEPRFTPDVAGDYLFHGAGAQLALHVVARTPAERWRNHYLTPLYGAARVGDEVWTANGASYTLTRIGADGGKRAEITVGAWPAAIASTGAYVLVAQRGADTLGFVNRARGVLEDALWVGDEPTAVVSAGARAWVSLPTMRQVAVVDLDKREVAARIDVGFDPRALALSPDGKTLYVAAYRSGDKVKDTRGTYGPNDDQDLWIIDTASATVTRTIGGISAMLRAIALSPDGRELFVAATQGDPEPSQADATAKPFVHEVVVIAVDPAAADFGQVRRRVDLTRQTDSGGPVVNPSGIYVTDDAVYVAAESSNLLVALDRATLAEAWRTPVAEGARQIVPLAGGVAVHGFQSQALQLVGTDGKVSATVALAADPRPPEVALGERIFTQPGTAFAANHSCASCHAETQNDGMVWHFGPNVWHNVRPLQLLDATTPLEWGAYMSNTQNFGYAGPSSIVARPATPDEAVGLSRFLSSLIGAPRATGWTNLDGSYTAAGLRGKALFEGKATCASCHVPPLYTSRSVVPKGKSGVPADVPTLLGVYRHGVYFVKGQARRLEDAIEVAIAFVGVDLTSFERADLLEFLRELTPKGAAPLGIWPDIDSANGIAPDVQPTVAFADALDDGVMAEDWIGLADASGTAVSGAIVVDGFTLRFVPAEPLVAGGEYVFRVKAGLPFRSGGVLEGDRHSTFTVAHPAAGAWPATLQMTVTVPSPMGGTSQLPFLMHDAGPVPGGRKGIIEPLVFGKQQRQEILIRLDGDHLDLQPFALPISPGGVANAAEVTGTVTAMGGSITGGVGTLRIGGPGIDIPGVAFTLALH